MDWKLLSTVFSTIFIAEIGDKTQLATLLYPRYLAWVAGIGFIAVGIWTIVKA